jgi:transcriptional regulator with XRE-family HTH domain
MKIGEAIRRVRREKNLTQAFVAEQAKITAGHLSKIETCVSDPDSEMTVRICVALDTAPSELFSIIEAENVPPETMPPKPFIFSVTHRAWESETDKARFYEMVNVLSKTDPNDADTIEAILKRFSNT